jgi:hypothetical protein
VSGWFRMLNGWFSRRTGKPFLRSLASERSNSN